MYLLNKIDKILLMDKIMLRIKKKLKSWESVLYFESQLYTIFSISIDETGFMKIELLLL